MPGKQDAEIVRQRHKSQRVKRETCEKGAIRSSWFEVPKTLNYQPRTLARPASLAQLSSGSILLFCYTCGPSKFSRANIVFPSLVGAYRDNTREAIQFLTAGIDDAAAHAIRTFPLEQGSRESLGQKGGALRLAHLTGHSR